MTILITLNKGHITYNNITYYVNKCKITYIFYLLLWVKSVTTKIVISHVCIFFVVVFKKFCSTNHIFKK
jgi:hypothetical protein